MTSNSQDTDMAQSRLGNKPPQNQQIKYAQRLKSTPTQAFKPDTHLCITIRWGVPSLARRRLDGLRAAGSC